MKRFFIVVLGCIFVLGMIFGCSKKEFKLVEKNKNNSEWFSNLDMEDVDGNKVIKEIFLNKEFIFINVWIIWCGLCVGEMLEFEVLLKEYESNNFNVVIKGLVVEVDKIDMRIGFLNEEKNLVKDIMKKLDVIY